MAFSISNSSGCMVEMNITPLVDVMLVLLIIFMVTMPLRTYPIGVDLPQRTNNPLPPPPPATPIRLKIDAEGHVIWNGSELPMSALRGAMGIEAQRYADPMQQPVIEIDTDKDAHYDTLASVLADAKNAGLIRIGFVDSGQR